MLAQILITVSAGIALSLGTIHLVYTFCSTKFSPRDGSLEEAMKQSSPLISRQTTMWRAWIGFNASHSLGAMLFGLIYGYLALCQLPVLRQSAFLMTLGALFLASFLVLAKRYWFRIPLVGLGLASTCYIAGLVLLQFAA